MRKETETLSDQLDQPPTTVPTADRSTWLHNDIPLILNIQPALYHYWYIYYHHFKDFNLLKCNHGGYWICNTTKKCIR